MDGCAAGHAGGDGLGGLGGAFNFGPRRGAGVVCLGR
jgi:hypothetical protein